MLLDKAFKRLRDAIYLISLAPRPLPSSLPPQFHVHEFCAYHHMTGHHTNYCASLCHSIQDLIDSGVASFPVSPTDIDSGPVHFSHVVPSPSGSCHHVLGT